MTKERFFEKISWYLPERLVYYAFIRFWANATTMDEGSKMTPTEMTWEKAMELWDRRYKK